MTRWSTLESRRAFFIVATATQHAAGYFIQPTNRTTIVVSIPSRPASVPSWSPCLAVYGKRMAGLPRPLPSPLLHMQGR